LKFSKGFNGEQTSRNSPALINIIAQKSLLWDGRVSSLEEMVLLPIKSHVEMGISKIENLPFKIANISYYPDLFEKAFGQREVTNEKIARALSQFLRSMVTHNTDFDNEYFSPEEANGKELFFWKDAGCNNCHRGENLNQKGYPVSPTIQSSFANIGLDEVYSDQGLGELDFINNGVFKIPSLRNIALTAPYMHDGRFSTLEEVVEHYNSGVKNHPNLDPLLKTGSGAAAVPQRLNLSKKEKSDLVAFLKTLTDPKITTDVRFSDPFIR
jgi:cytochrome c peroxidase